MSNALPHRVDGAAEAGTGHAGSLIEEGTVARRRTATRADLLEAVASTCPNLGRGEARDIFETMLREVADALARGESVKLRSFGLFSVREKRERIGRNPRTGVEVPIRSRRVLTFKPSPVLLQKVNEAEADGGAGA